MSENLSDLIKSISKEPAVPPPQGATESDKNNALEAIAKALNQTERFYWRKPKEL